MTTDPVTAWNAAQLRREQRLRRVLDGNYRVPGGSREAAIEELLLDIAAPCDEQPTLPEDQPQIWLSDYDKVRLLTEVWDAVFKNTQSFHDDGVGGELAYLLGAILHGVYYETTPEEESQALLTVLMDNVSLEHKVWRFILRPSPEQDPLAEGIPS